MEQIPESIHFVGVGGIGMSALVRYFLSIGKKVAGYDRTPSELTQKLIAEGANIHYEENVENIKLFLARNQYSEVENIAKNITKLVRDENYKYKEI